MMPPKLPVFVWRWTRACSFLSGSQHVLTSTRTRKIIEISINMRLFSQGTPSPTPTLKVSMEPLPCRLRLFRANSSASCEKFGILLGCSLGHLGKDKPNHPKNNHGFVRWENNNNNNTFNKRRFDTIFAQILRGIHSAVAGPTSKSKKGRESR